MQRITVFAYGVLAYALFLVSFLYAVGFIGGFAVPTTLDAPSSGSVGTALIIDVLLLTAFALQHSVMARPAFKQWWTQYVPEPAERSTYVLAASGLLLLMFWQWRPIGGQVWHVKNQLEQAVLYGLFAWGWLTVLVTTFLINHFDLFGLRQVWFYLRGEEYRQLSFVTPGPYKHVRHPLYVGWLFAFWATPNMTAAHLLFAAMTTAYILVAIQLEERDLVAVHGRRYAEYKSRVPMLIPRFARSTTASEVKQVQPARPPVESNVASHEREIRQREGRVAKTYPAQA